MAQGCALTKSDPAACPSMPVMFDPSRAFVRLLSFRRTFHARAEEAMKDLQWFPSRKMLRGPAGWLPA